MSQNSETGSIKGMFALLLALLHAVAMRQGMLSNPSWYKLGLITLAALLVTLIGFRKQVR